MKSLILGSSGQVGAALFEHLEELGQKPMPFDIARNPVEDLRVSGRQTEQLIAEADFVFFLAFDVGGSTYLAKFQDTFDFVHNNVRLMANTFELLQKHRKPFIFASSQMSNMSFSNYGLLKAVGERYTALLNGLTVKFWNVYGFESDPEKTHVITDFIGMAHQSKRIEMRTTGVEQRQFLYSEDCAEALLALADRYADVPRADELHITNFEWSSIIDVAQIISEFFPGTAVVPGQKLDTVQAGQRNEPNPRILDFWKPRTGLREGIGRVAKRMGAVS